ncbi:MAG: hypothetical protein H7834_13905 [Magnetococcus sp. YQC-9]
MLALRQVAAARNHTRSAPTIHAALNPPLPKSGNPRLETLAKVLDGCGLRMSIQVKTPPAAIDNPIP